MKFVAPPRGEWRGILRPAPKQRIKQGRVKTDAREHEIFVERSFEHACIRNSQHRSAGFDVVSDTQTRPRLTGTGDAVVDVAANSEVERPVLQRDCVLKIQGKFPDVGAAEVRGVKPALLHAVDEHGEVGEVRDDHADRRRQVFV